MCSSVSKFTAEKWASVAGITETLGAFADATMSDRKEATRLYLVEHCQKLLNQRLSG